MGSKYLKLLQLVQSRNHVVHFKTFDIQHLVDISIHEALVEVDGKLFSCAWIATLIKDLTLRQLFDILISDESHWWAVLTLPLRVVGFGPPSKIETRDELDGGPSFVFFVLVDLQ